MAIHKTPPKSRTVRKEAHRGPAASPDTGVGDSNRVRLPSFQRGASEPTPTRHDSDSLARAKTDFIRRAKSYRSTRGRVSQEKDFRFQPIVNRNTHERIREARRRLKHEPFNPEVDIPRAVAVDLDALHAHDCRAYSMGEVKNVRKKPKNKSL